MRLWATTITRDHLKMKEMDLANQKLPEMTYHMCLCRQKIILRPFWRPHLATGGLLFEKCSTLVLKYEGTSQFDIVSPLISLTSIKKM